MSPPLTFLRSCLTDTPFVDATLAPDIIPNSGLFFLSRYRFWGYDLTFLKRCRNDEYLEKAGIPVDLSVVEKLIANTA